MQKKYFFIIIITLFLFISSCQTPIPKKGKDHSTVTDLKKLTTSGQKIIEFKTNKEVTLRGIAFTGGVWQHPYSSPDVVDYYTTEWDFKNIRSWGANVVTFYMDYSWFNTEAGYAHVEKIFNWAKKYGIYIIPQITVYPVGGQRGGADFFNSSSAKADLKNFWKTFASRYKDRKEIAGYCLMDEPMNGPNCVTDTAFKDMLKQYTESIIDDIRTVDQITPIFVEGAYGQSAALMDIDPAKTHIVYNVHFYDPLEYTAQGFPWVANGGIPTNLNYPGEYVRGFNYISYEGFSINTGTYDWKLFEGQFTVPNNGANTAIINLGCNDNSSAVIYIDDVQYSVNGGSYQKAVNSSFEDSWGSEGDPLVWNRFGTEYGSVIRTDEASHDGTHSVKFYNCTTTGFIDLRLGDYWASTVGAINVTAGQTLKIKLWAKVQNSTHNNWITIFWIAPIKYYLDKSALQNLMQQYILDKRASSNRPFFVGEFTPSLASQGAGKLNFLSDMLEYYNANNIHWTYYVYRENWGDPSKLFLGVYNGPTGTTAENCPFKNTEIINTIKKFY